MWPRSEVRRVMVVGAPGAGKSTLARAVGARTGLPVHHMDLIHHLPGWVERPLSEKIPMARAVEESEAWVFEGGLSATYETRVARADLVVWLDLPVGLRLWRCFVVRRWQFHRGHRRPDLPEDCPERFDPAFLRWILRTRHANRERLARLMDRSGRAKWVHLRSRADVAQFTASIP